MVPLIVRVYGEGDDVLVTDVPVTPDTTCRDVIECCRDPGEEPCALVETWGTCERTLGDNERPLQILEDWGSHQPEIRFMLRYLRQPVSSSGRGGRADTRNGMKEPGTFGELPRDGVSLSELQDMATRQQQQIDTQHQLLVAKEQRLRFLKHQEARAHHVAAENDRLRRLRDRVEAQENKLRKLRALRGQVDQNKVNNATLTSDLDSIRGLFNEKEKELSLAVAKVEELTRQLEEVKRGRGRDQQTNNSPAVLELDKLRRELLYRNKLNEQQNARLSQQREALTQRQEEMTNIDKRISELQDRLHQKRLLNQQLANQITAASHKSNQTLRSVNSAAVIQQHPYQQGGKLNRPLISAGNIAAVEPYHHVPQPNVNHKQVVDAEKPLHRPTNTKPPPLQNREVVPGPFLKHSHQPDGIAATNEMKERPPSHDDLHAKLIASVNQPHISAGDEEFYLPEFGGSKSDPKYQTLPYNTKFTVNFVSGTKIPHPGADDVKRNDSNESAKNNNNNINNINNNINSGVNQQSGMTVLSAPVSASLAVNKVLKGVPTNQNQELPTNYQQGNKSANALGHPGLRPYGLLQPGYNHSGLHGLTRGQPVGGTSSTTSSTSSLATNSSASSSNSHQKPVSNVAPSSPHQKPSPIYQTSSQKILPVQPQILNTSGGPPAPPHGPSSPLSPPQGSSTPLGTPDPGTPKPALPPKPATVVKPPPPPRQGHVEESDNRGHRAQEHQPTHPVPLPPPPIEDPVPPCPPPPPLSEPPEDFTMSSRKPPQLGSNVEPLPLIKARPLTIKKQPISEHPKLKLSNLNGNGNGTGVVNNISINNNNNNNNGVHMSMNRRIEMPPAFLFPESEAPPADLVKSVESPVIGTSADETDRVAIKEAELEGGSEEGGKSDATESSPTSSVDTLNSINQDKQSPGSDGVHIVRRRKGNLKSANGSKLFGRRVSFDPLALLLDAALEGELELVRRTAGQVTNPSAANDEGITALHNAICAGHLEIVKFLVEFGCDVNAQDSDGWTPLHCAASCNNLAMVRFLVEHGACIFATTLSDHETAAEKCEEDEEGFDGCSEYLYSVQEKLGILNSGAVFAVFSYEAHHADELSFQLGEQLIVVRKGDESEREWWWSKLGPLEGYIPRNLLGLYPRVTPTKQAE